MPTKAEIEHQVKSLELQLAAALEETCDTAEDELHDLQEHNETLSA